MNQDDKKNQKEAAKMVLAIFTFPLSLPWIIASTKDKTDKPKKDDVSTVGCCVGVIAVIVIFLLLVAVCST